MILKDNELIVTIKKSFNLRTIDGLKIDLKNDSIEWIRIVIKHLHHIHRVYEVKRMKIQKKLHKKIKLMKRVLNKYSGREKNRVNDYLHKSTTFIIKKFSKYDHVFEDLSYIKEKITSMRFKTLNRANAKHDYRKIQKINHTILPAPIPSEVWAYCKDPNRASSRQLITVWNIAMKSYAERRRN